MVTLTALAAEPHAMAFTVQPRWLIEQTQLARLDPAYQQQITAANGSVIMADKASLFKRYGSNAEHYTTIAPCTQLMMDANYVAKCLSLEASPPPAGTFALYDPEEWTLTPTLEYDHQCKAIFEAASLIKAAGATAIIAPSTPTKQWLVECAARAAALTSGEIMIHLQTQLWETTSDFMHVLRQATRWAHDAQPGITVSFGLSTNPKYSPTAWRLWQAWQEAQSYLGGNAPCWLNVIKPTDSTAITMANRFLEHVYGG
jgi:hypothetical protein